MKLETLQRKVKDSLARVGFGIGVASDLHPATIELVAKQTVLALGFAVHPTTGDIYNPALEGDKLFPEQRNVRYAGRKRR